MQAKIYRSTHPQRTCVCIHETDKHKQKEKGRKTHKDRRTNLSASTLLNQNRLFQKLYELQFERNNMQDTYVMERN